MSSKINLQPCEYARKSSIFQDNQLIYDKKQTVFLSPFFFAVQFSCISQDPVFYVVILLKSFYKRI